MENVKLSVDVCVFFFSLFSRKPKGILFWSAFDNFVCIFPSFLFYFCDPEEDFPYFLDFLRTAIGNVLEH